MKKTILSLLFLFSLNASDPNWSFDNVHQGWNSEELAKMYFHYSELQRQWAWELLGKFPFKGNEKILDFGCGDGKITAEISRLVRDGFVLGVDLSPDMLHLAHIKFPPYSYPNLEFRKSDSLTFSDFSENLSFDLICSFAVFHLISSPLETLQNLKLHLNPNGHLLLVLTTGSNPLVYQAASETFAQYGIDPPWNNAASGSTMRTIEGCTCLLQEAGYRILSIETTDGENAFYSLEELILCMVGTMTANWNIPPAISLAFFTDLIYRMYEMDAGMIDAEGRVHFIMPRIHVIAAPLYNGER